MKIYLDVCCLNRPFDDQRQARIRLEAEAVLAVIERAGSHGWQILSGEALRLEISQTPDSARRQRVETLLEALDPLPIASSLPKLASRATGLEAQGLKPLDALHIASAEDAEADVFLTTDDRLLRMATRLVGKGVIRIVAANPLAWLTARLLEGESESDDP